MFRYETQLRQALNTAEKLRGALVWQHNAQCRTELLSGGCQCITVKGQLMETNQSRSGCCFAGQGDIS